MENKSNLVSNIGDKKTLVLLVVLLILTMFFFVIFVSSKESKPIDIQSAVLAEETSTSSCDNDIGNGEEIISGPSGPEENRDWDQVFRSLSVHPTDPNIVIMGTERNGFLKTNDGGNTWERLRSGLRHEGDAYSEIWNLAISPTATSTLLAAIVDTPGPITDAAGLYKSSDGGASWFRSNCGLPGSRVTSVVFDSGNENNAVAGIEGGYSSRDGMTDQYFDGGLYYTTDGGSNWQKGNIPGNYTKNGYWNLYFKNGVYYTFGFSYRGDMADNVGFLKSNDNGQNWTEFAGGFKNKLITSFDVSNDGQIIYANERDSYEIKKSSNGGTTWQSFLNQAAGPIAISPNSANTVIFASNNSLYRTINGMSTSVKVLESTNNFDDIVFAPSDPNIVYAATKGYLLYKSTNAGASWTLMKNLRNDVLNAS